MSNRLPHARLLRQLEEARAQLDARTEQLEIVADWSVDLRKRIARERLQFELVGGNSDEQLLLADEVKAFKCVCTALISPGKTAT
jgi:hypothetical protein